MGYWLQAICAPSTAMALRRLPLLLLRRLPSQLDFIDLHLLLQEPTNGASEGNGLSVYQEEEKRGDECSALFSNF